MRGFIVFTILALIVSAPRTWGYETPIENQTFEIIDNDSWILGTTNLTVGGNTAGNAMFILNGGHVQNTTGVIGFNTAAYGNKVYVIGAGSVWSNSFYLDVGAYGSSNLLSIALGGHVISDEGYIGYESSAVDNMVAVSGMGSVWTNSGGFNLGFDGVDNALSITAGGRVYNTVCYIGSGSSASGNRAAVAGTDSWWNNSGTLYVGGDAFFAGGTGNSATVTNGGTIAAQTLTVYDDNDFDLDSGGNLIIRSDLDASQPGFNWNSGGHLSIDGDLTGMPPNDLDGTDKQLTINGGTWTKSSSLYVGFVGSDNQLSITNGGSVESTWATIGVHDTASNNMVTVSGHGSVWSNSSGSVMVGSSGSGNKLSITETGLVQSVNGRIGYSSSNNTVNVDGSGSVWEILGSESSYDLDLGWFGSSNALFIINGGRIQNDGGGVIGYVGSSNIVTVSGVGSVWTNSDFLDIGSGGSGNAMSITGGGCVQNTYGTIGGGSAASSNTATVSGSGSVWSNSSGLTLGYDSDGNSLSIKDGGYVQNTWCRIGDSGSRNTVTVSGGNSVWSNSSSVTVGEYGSENRLSITGGGCVDNAGGYLGYVVNSDNNTAAISGADSKWKNANNLAVGFGGNNNTVYITGGGKVQNLAGYVGYQSGASSNSVSVSGGDSEWENSFGLYVGGNSAGAGGGIGNSVTITNSGTVAASSCTVYPTNTVRLQSGGALALTGTFNNQAHATLEMGISGDTGSDYGQVTAGGLATLDGTLKVVLLDGFEPDFGDTYDLFDWGSSGVNGGFATIDLPSLSLPFGQGWNTDKLYTDGELSVGYATADADDDGMPDGWELQYCGGDVLSGGNLDVDPHNNLAEYIAGTDPDDASSYFSITNAAPIAAGFMVEWDPSVSGREYTVNWTNELTNGFSSLATGIDFPQNSYTDAVYGAGDAGFYQIEVQLK